LEDAEPPLPGVLDTDFDGFVRSFLPSAHPLLSLGFRAGCLAAAWVSPVLIRRVPPITRLSPADRERALDAFSRTRVHSLRRLSGALRLVVALGYGGDERVRAAIGFPVAGREAADP
jgi:hypothetical protein